MFFDTGIISDKNLLPISDLLFFLMLVAWACCFILLSLEIVLITIIAVRVSVVSAFIGRLNFFEDKILFPALFIVVVLFMYCISRGRVNLFLLFKANITFAASSLLKSPMTFKMQ